MKYNRGSSGGDINLNDLATKRPKKHNFLRIFINTLAILIIIGSIGVIWAISNWDNVDFDEDPEENTGYEKIVKSDHKNVEYLLVCGLDESKNLTDVILMLCWDIDKNKATILQIPRDTYIGTDIQTNKINAVYGHPREGEGKAKALCRRINSYFGLPVDHYIFVSLPAFKNIVDTLGGVEVDVKQKMYYGGVTVYPGTQVLDGRKAEVFMRFRKGYMKGDAGRVEAQRQFYAGFGEKMTNMSIPQILEVLNAVKDDLVTDMSYRDMKGFLNEAKELKMTDVEVFAVPGEAYDHYYYRNGVRRWNALYTVHKSELVELLNQKMNPYGQPISEDKILIQELANTGYQSIEEGDTLDQYKDSSKQNTTE